MNKLIIVGNGFDLAHGLPTTYKNFIDDFWKNLKDNLDKELTKKIVNIDRQHDFFKNGEIIINSYGDFIRALSQYRSKTQEGNFSFRNHNNLPIVYCSGEKFFSFQNVFFGNISQMSVDNWVDIENTYYENLRKTIKSVFSSSDIKKLNTDFEVVKELLQDYLHREVISKYDFNESDNIDSILDLFRVKHKNLKGNNDDPIFLEFPPEDHEELINLDNLLRTNFQNPTQNLFLDFNYTPTVDSYVKEINSRSELEYGKADIVKIHGKIHCEENPINFGFGDEMDEDYRLIEKKNDNEYFRNIKSFQYMHNSNYRKLLNWIETGKFQVYIFGHSCGLSDRTLLNTIFENENCRSIKVFYHESENSDNFTDIINNISRHFDDKKIMRQKIVDKSISEELPQTVRFKEIQSQ